ncbi:Transmembrane emp24 domain-containing protein p24delta9, partial [Mucuna pruriens]
MSNSNLVLLLAPALMCSIVNSLQFEVKPGHPKCISEDIKSNVVTAGNYHVVSANQGQPIPDSHKISVRVRSPHGNGYHYGDDVFSGDFAFTAAEAGDYVACFSVHSDLDPAEIVTFEFVWRTGAAAKDWSYSSVPKKGQIDVLEMELKNLYDAVSSIHDEMFYLREREAEMQEVNNETNKRMFAFSFLSILVCLAVAGLQLWHLKTFFRRKKLL